MADTLAVTVHRLTNKDLSTLTAICSVDGLVAIRKAGNGHQCSVKAADSHRRWAQANPEKARANRRQRSEHELFGHDYVGLKAKCVLCGEVDLVAWGRGYTCGVRARELRSVQEAEPLRPCRECAIIDGVRVYPTADGRCLRCSDPDRYDTGAMLRPLGRKPRTTEYDGLEADYDGDSFLVSTEDPADEMPAYESAVPGWKTIGSSRSWRDA